MTVLPTPREVPPEAVPLADQAQELDRELQMRLAVFPGWVRTGKMTDRTAYQRVNRLRAALHTLQQMIALRSAAAKVVRANASFMETIQDQAGARKVEADALGQAIADMAAILGKIGREGAAPHTPQQMEALRADAERYRFLRAADDNAIHAGGIFIGVTPDNLVLTGEDADRAIDAARVPVGQR